MSSEDTTNQDKDQTLDGHAKSLRNARIVAAGAFISPLVAADLFFNFFCSLLPLFIYLFVGCYGALRGARLHARFAKRTRLATFVRRLGISLAIFSLLGALTLFVIPTDWNTKCAWRYCGRALGLSLTRSPFPVGKPSCAAWHRCANEYPYSRTESRLLFQRMDKQGCAAP